MKDALERETNSPPLPTILILIVQSTISPVLYPIVPQNVSPDMGYNVPQVVPQKVPECI